MYGSQGPRKRIDYSKPEGDDEDSVMFDATAENPGNEQSGESGGPNVTYEGDGSY